MQYQIGYIFHLDEYSQVCDYCNEKQLLIVEIDADEKGRRFQIQEVKYSKIELLTQQIEKLKQNLRNTDYIANKIADAYALYKLTGDDLHLDEIMTQYEPMLQQREQWREQIRELEKQINE